MKLTIEKAEALTAHKNANAEERAMLERLFGKETFETPITERLKSFEDACSIDGVNPEDILPFKKPESDEQRALNAFAMLRQIAKVLRGNWVPDWNNTDEMKWYPWFKFQAGFSFSDADYGYTNAHSSVGSRLCFPNSDLAEYFGTQFLELHQILLTTI